MSEYRVKGVRHTLTLAAAQPGPIKGPPACWLAYQDLVGQRTHTYSVCALASACLAHNRLRKDTRKYFACVTCSANGALLVHASSTDLVIETAHHSTNITGVSFAHARKVVSGAAQIVVLVQLRRRAVVSPTGLRPRRRSRVGWLGRPRSPYPPRGVAGLRGLALRRVAAAVGIAPLHGAQPGPRKPLVRAARPRLRYLKRRHKGRHAACRPHN